MSESAMIIFSVLLALVLSELVNSCHEKKEIRNSLQTIVEELKHNKQAIAETQVYNIKVLHKIDSILGDKGLQKALVENNKFHLEMIAPDGVLFRYLDNEAWTIAKDKGIASQVDYSTIAMLTKVYDDQARMMKTEEEIAKIIFDRNSRDPEQVAVTLRLISDVYRGWSVDRADGVMLQINSTIKKIQENL